MMASASTKVALEYYNERMDNLKSSINLDKFGVAVKLVSALTESPGTFSLLQTSAASASSAASAAGTTNTRKSNLPIPTNKL